MLNFKYQVLFFNTKFFFSFCVGMGSAKCIQWRVRRIFDKMFVKPRAQLKHVLDISLGVFKSIYNFRPWFANIRTISVIIMKISNINGLLLALFLIDLLKGQSRRMLVCCELFKAKMNLNAGKQLTKWTVFCTDYRNLPNFHVRPEYPSPYYVLCSRGKT